jgi:adenosylcobinamide hydrolase
VGKIAAVPAAEPAAVPDLSAPELVSVDEHPALVWRLPSPLLAVSSSPVGGGIGLRSWVLNVQVPLSYDRHDVEDHLGEIADRLGLHGAGVGFLTAASVGRWTTAGEAAPPGPGVRLDATVGIAVPTWAAADVTEDGTEAPLVGTINLVGRVGRRMSDAALVNAVATLTEAKVQALLAAGIDASGTASDAACVLCPADGAADPFGGPRSALGAPLARATFAAVRAGVDRFREDWPEAADRSVRR